MGTAEQIQQDYSRTFNQLQEKLESKERFLVPVEIFSKYDYLFADYGYMRSSMYNREFIETYQGFKYFIIGGE